MTEITARLSTALADRYRIEPPWQEPHGTVYDRLPRRGPTAGQPPWLVDRKQRVDRQLPDGPLTQLYLWRAT